MSRHDLQPGTFADGPTLRGALLSVLFFGLLTVPEAALAQQQPTFHDTITVIAPPHGVPRQEVEDFGGFTYSDQPPNPSPHVRRGGDYREYMAKLKVYRELNKQCNALKGAQTKLAILAFMSAILALIIAVGGNVPGAAIVMAAIGVGVAGYQVVVS